MGDALVTNRQAAELWGIPYRTWTSYVARGSAPQPVSHVMGHPLYSEREVIEAGARRRRRPPGGAPSDVSFDEVVEARQAWRSHTAHDSRRIELRSRFDAAIAGLVDSGLTIAAIAHGAGVSVPTVNRALGRARENLDQLTPPPHATPPD